MNKAADETTDAPAADDHNKSKLGVFQVVGSILAAMFGVQSSENRRRDFEQGRLGVFIVGGILFGVFFVAALYAVVSLVLSAAR